MRDIKIFFLPSVFILFSYSSIYLLAKLNLIKVNREALLLFVILSISLVVLITIFYFQVTGFFPSFSTNALTLSLGLIGAVLIMYQFKELGNISFLLGAMTGILIVALSRALEEENESI